MLSGSALGLVLAMAALQPTAVRAYDFSTGDNIADTYSGAVPSGETWNLTGSGVYLASGLSLNNTAGPFGLTIYGNDNTLTLNNGADFGKLVLTGSNAATLTLSDVTITGGSSDGHGGVIESSGSVTFTSSGSLTLAGNAAEGSGGAIYARNNSAVTAVTFNHSGALALTGNTALNGSGGAIYAYSGNVEFNGSGTVEISRNKAMQEEEESNGGAIFARGGDVIFGADTTGVTIADNQTENQGGAIYALNGASVAFNGSGAVMISGNIAGNDGGAIYTNRADVTFGAGTGPVTLLGNKATYGYGGAIDSFAGNVTFNGGATITSNQAGQDGGAINVDSGNVAFNGSSPIEISGNKSGRYGGAIAAYSSDTGNANVRFSGTGPVTLSGNTAAQQGGAIYADRDVTFETGGGSISISGNKATKGHGGAIFSNRGNVEFTSSGTVAISGNEAGLDGGAIHVVVGDVAFTTSGTVTVSGNRSGQDGGAIYAGGDVSLSTAGGSITFSGNTDAGGANAVYLYNNDRSASLALNAEAGPSGAGTITFFDPVRSSARALVSVAKTGDGMVSFDGANYADATNRWSKIYASTAVEAGTFEVANGAVYGVLAADVEQTTPTSFTSAAGTMVQGGVAGEIRADNVTLNGDLSIAGRQGDRRGVFTITSKNLTFNDTVIHFNTFLNDGVVQNTDRLVLNLDGSTVSGHALVAVTDVDPGAWAYTPGNGIQLVQTNDGVTPNGTFTLAAGPLIRGAYTYRLFRGAVDENATDANNWYLRTEYVPPEPTPPTPPGPTPAPVVPEIQPGVAVATALTPLALTYGYALLDTLHERVGETHLQPLAPVTEQRKVWCKDRKQKNRCVVTVPVPAAPAGDRWASSGWARLIGERGLHQPDNFMQQGPNYDYTFGGIQAGLDLFGRQQRDGTLDKAGFYAAYGQVNANVKGQGNAKAGDVDMDAYTLGAYWTHRAAQGWYTDAVVQATWYSTDASTVLGQKLKPDGFGILGSLEGGYAFNLGNGFSIEPQAQIVYQNVSFDDIHAAYTRYAFADGDSLRGRIGARLAKSWAMEATAAPRLITGWVRANIWHEFIGDTRTATTNLLGNDAFTLPSSLEGTWGEIGAGVTAQVSDKINLFASASYQHSLDDKSEQSWDGRLGMTVKW